MDNLIFSLNATIPIFLLMVCGYVFRRLNWIDEIFATKMNSFVFKVALPVMLIYDLASVDFVEAWDTVFVLYCFFATLFSVLIATGISMLWKDKSIRGEFVQGCYRSSAAILGIAFIQNIYGTSGMGPLMIIGSVPLYNVAAVLVLSVFKPGSDGKVDKKLIINTAIGVAKNPIVIGVVLGFLWSFFRIPMPVIAAKTLQKLGSTATPLGLMAMGATFDFSKATGKIKPALVGTFIKLIGLCAVFLPGAALLGFRDEKIIALLVMLGSCSTVAGYVMAKNMGHEGTLAASCVMLTTLLSAFTLTTWLFLLKTLGLA